MRVLNEIKPLRDILFEHKLKKKKIGLIPTMGALHEGHLALIKTAQVECDITVCSIYVNPTQFDNTTDLQEYPNTIEQDLQLLESIGCDIVFCPENHIMYKNGNNIKFDFGDLDKVMEGKFRKSHFSGVATIVSKLLNIVEPDYAYFGQKDLQQYIIIERLVESLLFDTKLRCVPIQRDQNGLALSSRNLRLSNEGLQAALVLNDSLNFSANSIKKGENILEIKNKIKLKFAASIAELEYLEIVDRTTLTSIDNATVHDHIAVCIAAYIEGVRLIDNMLIMNETDKCI